LEEVLACARRRLAPGGWFVFSLEELLPDSTGSTLPRDATWILQRQGRYAHKMSYVAGAARGAGFTVGALERETVRFEGDAPVAGMLVLLERPNES
jgi:predicted TPR repeat methyltransferase